MIERKMQMGDLYAFYGQLLTEKQQEIVELYMMEDLSLGEISEQLGITRQAVHDMVRRSEKTLMRYEEKLGLFERFERHREELKKINAVLHGLRDSLASERQTLEEVIESVNRLID